MSTEALLARIASNPRLPSPPAVALQVLDRASRPDCALAELSRIIAHDPALCGKLLRMVNSALFGLPRAVTSIDRALNLLGLKRVRSLVISLTLPAMQRRDAGRPQVQAYWKASVAAAIAARELAVKRKRPDPESELVASLLCDLGMLIMQEVFPQEYGALLDLPAEVLALRQCALEEQAIGVGHAEVGAYLLSRWKLPAEITEAIRHHHQPARASDQAQPVPERAWLLHFATQLGQLQVAPAAPGLRDNVVQLARDRYDMDERQLEAFLEPLQEKIESFAALLSVNIGTCQPYPTLLATATEQLTQLVVETSLENRRIEEVNNQLEREKEQIEAALRRSEEQLRQSQKMEAIGRLAGGVAHDFNNLLTIINGYGEMLLNRLPRQEPARGLVEQIKKAGERASALTAQLLAFSRKQDMKPVVLDLNATILNLHKMLRRLIGEDVDLVNILAPGLATVTADPSQIEQVLLNLVVNARDAMPKGGQITVETANVTLDRPLAHLYGEVPAGPYVLLAVRDTGCGMSEETRSHLFEPFYTTKAEGKGTGLGLAMVYGIVHQSNGHIAFTSEEGKGTVFHIYLPPAGVLAAPAQHDAAQAPAPTGSETILLAEDEEGVRTLVRTALEHAGYTVVEAEHGLRAFEIGAQHAGPIHLLLTDAIMPHLSGSELARRLVQFRPALKVLYISGHPEEDIVRRGALDQGAPFLAKPFSGHALASKVREVLGGKAAKYGPGQG